VAVRVDTLTLDSRSGEVYLTSCSGGAINISSAIIYAMPGRADSIRAQVAALPGVQIHVETPDGRFIVTIEDGHGAAVADTVMQLHRLEGVLSAAMVYQYSDDELQREEAQP
jgi:periplasmic nitrate reductase NapD